MSVFARSVTILWVLIMASLSSAKGFIVIRNELDGNFDLNIYCPNFDHQKHIIASGNSYLWDKPVSLFAGKSRFICYFRWRGASHTFDLCTDSGGECYNIIWHVTQAGPCLKISMPVCYKWLS